MLRFSQVTKTGHFTQIPSGKADECNRDFATAMLSLTYKIPKQHSREGRVYEAF